MFGKVDPLIKQLVVKMSKDKIKLSSEIYYNRQKELNLVYEESEKIYEIVDAVNPKHYKNVDRFINFHQKRLQKFLFTVYNVKIVKSPVTRAWLKIYEIYNNTNFFDNLNKDKVKAFHLCEAPGNFIAGTLFYTKHNTDIKEYDWYAQSLVDGQVFDMYGMITYNLKRWDFGPTGNGDITDWSNFKHYVKKFKGVDMVVGDCGGTWKELQGKWSKLVTLELLCCLILPKKGGNFIMKTQQINFDTQFMSLVYLANSIFDKVFVFKSTRNIWSAEIFIVGIGKQTTKFDKILYKIAEGLDQGKTLYPTDYLDADFSVDYEDVAKNMITVSNSYKESYAGVARRWAEFNPKKKEYISQIDEKNIEWLQKNMPHLKDVEKEYRKYIQTQN